MAVKTGKAHSQSAVVFDTLGMDGFDTIATVGAGVANTVVQSRLPLPFRCKIRRVVASASGIGSGGQHTVQLVVGTGALGAVGPQDGPAVAGNILLNPALILTAADLPVVQTPAEPDVIYQPGTLLTVRAVTPGATGSLTNLRVVLALLPIDGFPTDNGVNVY